MYHQSMGNRECSVEIDIGSDARSSDPELEIVVTANLDAMAKGKLVFTMDMFGTGDTLAIAEQILGLLKDKPPKYFSAVAQKYPLTALALKAIATAATEPPKK